MRWVLVTSPNQLATAQEETASSCIRGGLDWILGKMSLLEEWSGLGPGCPGQGGSPHPWRLSKTVWMWHLGTRFSRHGGVGLTVGPDDLRGLFWLLILWTLTITDDNLPWQKASRHGPTVPTSLEPQPCEAPSSTNVNHPKLYRVCLMLLETGNFYGKNQ